MATDLKNVLARHIQELAIEDEMARLARFRRAWDAYYGRFPKPLRVKPGTLDDNVTVNFARIIVDKGVSFLFGQEVIFQLDPTRQTEAETWLDACWRANRKMTLLQKLAVNGAVCGHAFIKIVPNNPYPRLIVLDPATVSVRWEPDDIDTVTGYRIQYSAIDPKTGRPVVRRQLIDRDGQVWRITDQVNQGEIAWVTTGESVWPYSWPPIIDCQNLPAPNEYWGIADLEDDVIQLNHAINFVLSNLTRIIRFHAHPKLWGRRFDQKEVQFPAGIENLTLLPGENPELHLIEMKSDLSSSVELYLRLRECLHELARIPEVATGKLDRTGPLSGVALAILYQPLLEKTETKRRTYGDLLVELNRRLLALGGFGEENLVTLQWPPLLPRDPQAEAQTSLLLMQLGVSQETILERLGFNPALEAQRRETGSRELGEQLLSAFERGE